MSEPRLLLEISHAQYANLKSHLAFSMDEWHSFKSRTGPERIVLKLDIRAALGFGVNLRDAEDYESQ